jgi:hypothetical protein
MQAQKRLTDMYSTRNIHNTHQNHRILDTSDSTSPPSSENAPVREAARHHRRSAQVWASAHAQVEGESERHVFYRKDVVS